MAAVVDTFRYFDMPEPNARYPLTLLALFAAIFAALAIAPSYREDWLLENWLVFAAIPTLVLTYRNLRFSNFSYTLIFAFLVLHEIRPEHKERVLAQCAQALRPGGLMLVFDERYASSPPELRDPTQIFAVIAQWYEGHWGNIINTREEIHALLDGAGLRPVDETSLSRFYIVTAEKPAS